MSIIGSLEDLSLADIIQIIAGSQKTGILYVNSNEGRSAIAFNNGFVVSASKPDLGNRLGQLLRKQDEISELDLELCLREQAETGKPLGEILLDHLLVTRDQLRATMKQQVMETINEIVNLKEGSFSFHSNAQLPADMISIDPQHLLLDVAYLQDTYGSKSRAGAEKLFSPQNLISEMEEEPPSHHLEGPDSTVALASISLLRELSEELARPRESTEVSLLVLRLASEFFDRCLFFVSSGDSLVACGGFGFPLQSAPKPSEEGRIIVPLSDASIFKSVYETMHVYRGTLLEGEWGKDLISGISSRLPNEILVLPIVCQGKVIALLYGDNGDSQQRIKPSQLLEILLLQAGMALENTLLREKLLRLMEEAELS